ncbi:MAG: thiamine phosphate synthase [Candidatus Aminicenantes bacterium]|nr:thiamine phosphate synthase [Candidatus Aminicenantes bacterium]
MNRLPDPLLILVTDRGYAGGRPLPEIVRAALRGGVTAVQLREKDCPAREVLEIGKSLLAVCRPLGVPLIVNDRADIALALGAEGLHVGQHDLSVRDARRLLGPGAVLGLSVETEEQAIDAEAEDVDYLGVSPVFVTPTKPDARNAWGIEGLRRLRRRTRRLLVAIGGVNARTAAAVAAAGADGLAVVSAVCGADDPERAAREIRDAMDEGRARRTA